MDASPRAEMSCPPPATDDVRASRAESSRIRPIPEATSEKVGSSMGGAEAHAAMGEDEFSVGYILVTLSRSSSGSTVAVLTTLLRMAFLAPCVPCLPFWRLLSRYTRLIKGRETTQGFLTDTWFEELGVISEELVIQETASLLFTGVLSTISGPAEGSEQSTS